ncbi:talin-2 isoform X1 [Bos indicus x Bos taurus]|uniref:talin-2 isoform X1 n=1 Tax=Bos indicus x Bos taurus TaxID=30522 RepID=UPI000F7D543F|nr:talin-2 isoform X1 [Bos indicus x Bos taurus]XP_027409635.1 talin-2 isoform X1 [Bos indicus x Bos taurus]XP_027409636.1 talin-2 isoform X1 [Bos indicus x Bos taurus]XP_027409637.1 talin-2 isoform X1 [Bos indicus x Bos taurus]XP_027409638.1 talin-2 isoform X1 [Bos indicus x Bos taurus]XP_027409639.1 talin-2 isoform X1 [Bos indicus x Bos taurus]XP_027409640.1 talin-2 isoform X1 [Bos indicus x Bos taurus]XP_061287089.1 talin-2 isoform X1 [Bos javanicus]XP_061287090.1 talin-2 isoform X1 [Bos
MVALSLKICVRHCNVVKTMQFEPSTAVYDACRVIRERVPEAQTGQASDYGLFLSDEDPRKGIWLEAGRTLDYYMLRNGDILEYKKKQRPQKIRMLDGSVKTVMVDDSKTVGELLVTICSRIGITNYEEYSLIQETIEEKKEEGTGTLKKDRTLLRDERKMEKLKAKLHTDDDLNWLDHSRTFREQGVDENETLLLRRKFFYSDQNVDSRDPVQLNLLYVQARDDILNGSHPVSFEKACEFGGFQAQIQFGPHVEHKHKPGFLDLKEFLPKEYIKQRGAEKRIFQEHKNCGEMSEIEAKVKYVKLARSLRTYGVSFFLVKEKMKGKNKLVPRLLGITKDSVMRVDEKTKEVLQEWPLTTVKRWAASPKSFTLDFGEYQESYYSVQTTEGEQISQLIAGYIDIILKKKQSKDRFGLEGDEESTMLEESVSPKKSTILQQQFNRTGKVEHGSVALPAVMRSGSSGPETFNVGSMPSPQQQVMVGQMHRGHMPPLTSAQQALMGTINTSMHAVQQAQDDLSELDSLPPLGQDMASRVWVQNKVDESKHEIHSQVDAITAGTASVVNLTAGDPADTDYTAVGCAITTISSNLTEMSKGVKLLAALMDDEVGSGEDLLRAARTLAGAVSDLLKAVQPTSGEPRQTVLTAAGSIGQASGDLLRQIGENETDERFQDVLMSLAKAVANAAAMLVLKAKNVAQVAEDTVLQNRVIAAATQCALSTSQLVACAKVVSPTISSPVCQEQLIEAGKLVDRSVENCVRACQAATDDTELLKQVSAAASVVSQALHDLLQHVRQFASRGEPIGRYDQATDTIMCVTESIFSSMGDAGEMVRQARVLAQATSDLVNAMRSDAEAEIDMENSKKLLAAAKLLADSTARMVEAAKGAAANPENEDQQQRLREAAEGLRVATNAAAQNAIKKKIVNRLEVAAKQAAAAATQTIAASQNAAVSNKNPAAQQQLVQSCKAVADHIPQLVQGVRGSQAQAEDLSAQLALIISSQNFLQPGSKMVSSAKAAVPTVSDQAAAMQLSQCAKNLATSLAELRTASQKAHEACGPMEIDSALSTVQTLKSELQDAKMAAVESQLKPLPGETLEKCAQDLGSTSKAVGSSMAQLLTCAAQGNEHYTGETRLHDALRPGVAARETAQALKTLAQAARGVAASTSDPAAARAMLDSARDVMEGSAMLIQEAKQALIAPGDAESQQRLAQVAKAVSHSLNNCVNCLPGQKDVDVALKSIGESSKKLLVDSLPPSTKPFQEAQSELNQAAADLNQSAGEVVHATRGQSGELAAASGKFSDDFDEFLDAGIEMAGQAQTKEDQIQVIGNLKNISMASSKLLLAAKSLSVDPGAPNAKNLLAAAARAVTESINQLITLCTQQAPGQKECDNALRELETVKGMLDNPNEPVSDLSYFDCIESVMENSKVLGESMAGISQNAKTGDLPAFGECVGIASKALCGLTEAAAQAAYLVGVSDPNSQAGHQGLVDPIQFARANQAIQMACQNLVDPGSSPSQVLSAATIVAKHTSALCNACRIASSKTGNPVAKRHFVQSAKEVANSTANLVKTIKALDGDFSEDNRNKCRVATAPLIAAVENLTAFASNPEFVSVPAQISSEGSQAQEPILVSAKTMLESSSYLIRTARSLAINPKDPPTWSVLAGHSHTVSDSIKSLITSIRDKAPGQRECDFSIDSINRCIRDIEQASLAAVSQSLATRDDISVEALQEQLTSVVQEIGHLIDPIATAARGEAAQLGHKVTQLASYFEPLILAAVGVASKILDHQQQMTVLDQTKTLAESALQMLYAAKEGGGNPKAQHTHDAITEAAQLMKEAVDDIMVTLNEAASEVGLVGGMVDAIAEAMSKLDEGTPPEPKGTFVDYQTTVVKYSKAIAVTAQEMMTKSVTNPEELGGLASQMTSDYGHLALQGQLAAATAEPEEIGFQIRTRVQDLGHGCIFLVQKAGALQVCPTDSYTKRELIECARAVTEKVSLVLSALQAGNKGTQACITAATAVSGIIADLDTTIMFATAGTLNAENNETFADHRENILKTAKALVEDTKLLVSGAASTPDKLAQAAQSSAATITQLAEVVKLGAASLGSDDPETQVVLINAIKDVAKALSDLIGATKGAASKPADDPSMYQLKGAAKVMVTNVTSLLKTVKAVEDEATRGTRALEATIEYMKQELTVFQSKEVPEKTSSPEESIRMTKGITMATAKAVAAGNSCRQEDVIATANLSRKAVSDMLTACKQASFHPDVSEEVRTRALRYGTECTLGYLDLLEHVLVILQKPTPELKHQLAAFSKRVAGAVTELIQAAEAMKGTEWVDPEDPTVIAETELLGAAASIEAAAKKLEQLKPRAKPKQADETLDFEEQILEAAKSIAAATSALVKSASAAQRELVAQGKVGSIPANAADDGQWSQGLISAARMVAAATSSLCEAANASVQGHASEEKLISSAKQVAASTAQLLVACKVKADQDSEAMRRLQVMVTDAGGKILLLERAAGNAVKRASDNLVRAAQKAAFGKADDDDVVVKTKFVGGIAQIIAAQEEMLKKERELEEARKKLAQIRQQQYKFLPTELREDEG